jgi:hypothetical protein
MTTNKNEKFNTRMYVSLSDNSSDYMEIALRPGQKVYENTYVLRRDAFVAGKESLQKILDNIPEAKGIKLGDWDSMNGENWQIHDFMNNDAGKIRDKVIYQLKKQGYDAIMDPVDSGIGIGFDYTAMIFINDDVLKLSKQKAII